jgi:DNA-binding GntR family transcriptional regulator
MTVFSIGRATRFTLRESVTDRLRTAIGEGTLAPGTHLAEVELSGSLGVSRATLREALRQLQQEGLLVQDQRGRVSVRHLTGSEVYDIFEVRTGLEQIAIGRLCALPDREPVVAALQGKLDRLKYQVSLAEDLDADLNFHGAMCELAGNQTLYQAWSNISGLVRVTMIAAGPKPARENMQFERHCPIVDLIAAGDAEAAHRFLAEHMDTAAQRLVSRMSQTTAP